MSFLKYLWIDQVFSSTLACEAIKKSALHTDGSAGPSGIDARVFKQLCTSIGRALDELYWRMLYVTQGKPLSMSIYDVVELPLIIKLDGPFKQF